MHVWEEIGLNFKSLKNRKFERSGWNFNMRFFSKVHLVKEPQSLKMMLGGYSSHVFVDAPDMSLICAVCLEVLREPVQCCNGHLFCSSCAKASIEYNHRCPTCRCYLDNKLLSISLIAKMTVDNCIVHCPSPENAVLPSSTAIQCDWIGPLKNLQYHKDNECNFTVVKCSNVGCRLELPRCRLARHQLTCVHKANTCEYCSRSFPCIAITKHYMHCRYRPVSCPNKCRRQPFRHCDLHRHLSRDCPNALINCTYYAVGCGPQCNGRVRRAALKAHTQDRANMNAVTQALFQKVASLEYENTRLVQDNNRSRGRTTHSSRFGSPSEQR